ncbi:MAG: DUF268 domain-containing protein [Bacteroidota bacterium]
MLQRFFRIIRKLLWVFGLAPDHLWLNIRSIGWFIKDYFKFQKSDKEKAFPFKIPYPVFSERFAESGRIGGHYFHQDLLVANKIFNAKPNKHVDVGSRTDGFVAHVASFREIEVVDIRKADVNIRNIKFIEADFMVPNPEWEEYTDSISSLHVIEHFGLGRYNDPIDPAGYLKGLDNIYSMLKKGGKFYFSTPIGPQRINFNAHRVFSMNYLKELLLGRYMLDSFSYIDDSGDLHENADVNSKEAGLNFNCTFGCGVFELTKK